MDSSTKPSSLFYFTVMFFLYFGLILPTVKTSSDYKNLIYKDCANQTNLSLSTMLSSLFQELLMQSSKSKFFETNIGDDTTAISGLFQCRGDLSNDDCHNCVNTFPEILSNSLCSETIPARIQLSGCYMRYEADGAATSLQLLHKTCSQPNDQVTGGFEEQRDSAFAALLNCAGSSNNGFCDMIYQQMHVTAQCEGNLEGCECGECVSNAVQITQDECKDSISGEIYMQNCFISYGYDSNGMPSSNPSQGNGTGSNSGKLVAIVVGGAAALSLGMVFWYYVKSQRKKSDHW